MVGRTGSKRRGKEKVWRSALISGLVAALVLGLLSGCGESKPATQTASVGSSTSRSAVPSSVIARADRICRQMNVEFANGPSVSGPVAEIARITPIRARREKDVVHKLQALQVSAAIKPKWEALLKDRTKLALALVVAGKAAKDKETLMLLAVSKAKEKLHAEVAGLARKLGFKDCGKVG